MPFVVFYTYTFTSFFMKKILLTSMAAGALILGGCTSLSEEENNDTHMPSPETMENSTENSMDNSMGNNHSTQKNTEESITAAGKMIEYTAENLSNAIDNDETVILAFSASWCPSCQAIEKDILKNLSNIPENVTLIKADYDTEKDLIKKYSIKGQHTFVQLDSNQNAVKTWRGSPTLKALIAEIQ